MENINLQQALNLLRRINNHLTERESYEEATTDAGLSTEIEQFFNQHGIVFKDGSEVEIGDTIFLRERIEKYNEAMSLSLDKKYAVI